MTTPKPADDARALNELVDILFERAYRARMTWSSLARTSGLSYATIRNLGERRTKRPQFRTVQRIARAVGGSIEFSATNVKHKYKITWKPRVFNGRAAA